MIPALDSKPSVIGWEWIIQAYFDLSTCRTIGMSPGPIPWTAVDLWAERNALSATEYEELEFFIRRMDSKYQKLVREESEKKRQ